MTNGHGTDTPADKFATAQAILELVIRLTAEVYEGRIDTSIYQREVTVNTGGPGLRLPAFPTGTNEDLRLGFLNLGLSALSASALTADETLDEVFGKIADDTEASRVGIRVMVNQMRNAFAHNPWRPRWVINSKYRKTYLITLDNGTAFTFDATKLDGDGLKAEHVGGLEFWVELLQHCQRLVA